MKRLSQPRWRCSLAGWLLALLAWPLLAAGPPGTAPVANAAEDVDTLPRHPLELQALSDPDGVLSDLPAALRSARDKRDPRLQALLHLAEANACRVIGDWACQRQAGADARAAAVVADEPVLQVRGIIAEALARMKLQDFTRSERLLAEAEAMVVRFEPPLPQLHADVLLNYSSLSQMLGKHQVAIDYAQRGLTLLPEGIGLAMQVRLLRNLARSQAQIDDFAAASATLARAERLGAHVNDPKLSAEILLEAASMARAVHDFSIHDAKVRQVLALGHDLGNRQIIARGHEAAGLALMQQGRASEAVARLEQAWLMFRETELVRDERRSLRQLVAAQFAAKAAAGTLAPLIERMLQLETTLDEADRAQAADDFEARLRYAEQEAELERLQVKSALAAERQAGLERVNRLTIATTVLGVLVLAVLAVFFLQLRRNHAALRAANERLQSSQAQTQDLLRLNAAYVFLLDTEGRLLQANPATAFALGRSPKQLLGLQLAQFLDGDGERAQAEYLQRLREQRQDESVLAVRDMQGRARQWRVVSRLSSPLEATRYIVASGVDITEQLQQTEALREQSLHDALTGCYNRRYLDEFERRYQDSRWAAVNIDLDHFKLINDEQGHERGDQVLQEIARFLSERVRAEDAVVRLGGDEFLLLIGRAEPVWVDRLLDRLRQDAPQASCGFSLGAELRENGESLAQTLARADAAMYRAKDQRRRQA
ncbi:MAG TPA: sensor domain-containing diguanylate cyclase [Arenimonas sp.]|nr:sensor domain-containing diguanylate cyclase [Arenimonas sp.]